MRSNLRCNFNLQLRSSLNALRLLARFSQASVFEMPRLCNKAGVWRSKNLSKMDKKIELAKLNFYRNL